MPESSPVGWEKLAAGWPWFHGEGSYPLPGYSEFNPPPRLVRKPYGTPHPPHFDDTDPYGWPVTEFEEALELRPGLHETARELMPALTSLARGQPGESLRGLLQGDNPYWPEELSRIKGGLPHERCVLILPLALSLTQDERCRVVWTLFGGSEQGPGRAFWQGFATGPDQGWDEARAAGFFGRLLGGAFDEQEQDLARAGLRFLPWNSGDDFPGWDDGPLPRWAERLAWSPGQSLRGVRYLLTFCPFALLPPAVRHAYIEGSLHLLPFPGSMIFWGAREYHALQEQLPLALQVPMLMLREPHVGPNWLRTPQAGWFEEPGPLLGWAEQAALRPRHPHGPVRQKARRPHRHSRFFSDGEEESIHERVAAALFSTDPAVLGLYNKPMARNIQVWTDDFRLLLDGPMSSPALLERVGRLIAQGGRFGYRFVFPPMRVGSHELYWHRPLVAYQAHRSGRTTTLDEAPLGYLTAYPVDRQDPFVPATVLWPRMLRRDLQTAAADLFRREAGQPTRGTVINVRNLLDAHELRGGPLPYSLAHRLLYLEPGGTVEGWLEELAKKAPDPSAGQKLAASLRNIISPAEPPDPPKTLTFAQTARRPFEVAFWKAMAELSAGKFRTKNNGDCVRDAATQSHLKHHRRDLDRVGDTLIARHRRAIERAKLSDRAYVGEHHFKWETQWAYPWMGGWADNQEGKLTERNIFVVIPGQDRTRAVIMADHYDTAFMRDKFDPAEGGDGARLAAPGADDNGSATATLLLAAPIFLEMSRKGHLACDVWLVHLTGEEFPADGIGARRLSQDLVQRTLRLRRSGNEVIDLSGVEVIGTYVLDMIAHRTGGEHGVFQISPGAGRQAMWLAEQSHEASEAWNAWAPVWNRRARGRGRYKRSRDPRKPPAAAEFPTVLGEVRPAHDPRSTLFNADSQTFSDAGIPVVLLMEDYDISRVGYHDSDDTMKNIDLDYGSALAAIAIESVARAASDSES